MNILDIITLLGGLGLGGAVGAALALTNTGRATALAFNSFKTTFHAKLDGKSDPDSLALKSAFSTLEGDVSSFNGAFSKLLRALRPR